MNNCCDVKGYQHRYGPSTRSVDHVAGRHGFSVSMLISWKDILDTKPSRCLLLILLYSVLLIPLQVCLRFFTDISPAVRITEYANNIQSECCDWFLVEDVDRVLNASTSTGALVSPGKSTQLSNAIPPSY